MYLYQIDTKQSCYYWQQPLRELWMGQNIVAFGRKPDKEMICVGVGTYSIVVYRGVNTNG